MGIFAAGTSPVRADVLIKVDKSAQRMSVLIDGKRRYSWPVSTGRKGYATPTGSFTPSRLVKDHASKEWDGAPMPHSIFFTHRGHAIHGSHAIRRLGSPASHGCIRLSPSNAAKLFALVRKEGMRNTKIVVRGKEPGRMARKSHMYEPSSP
ncbi:L,D-transpeptidase [Microvirga sp. GCM10011540]|uniref:L,D-transpeptidase n=1 Tax=Microvirga sp. GCM10011540 TaxID=3317338 RepID=UPI00361D9153